MIPSDAVGIFASDNDNPTQHKDSSNPGLRYRIVSNDGSTMVLESLAPTTDHAANYLGAIVSADRQTIYWVNDTKPLP